MEPNERNWDAELSHRIQPRHFTKPDVQRPDQVNGSALASCRFDAMDSTTESCTGIGTINTARSSVSTHGSLRK